MSTTCFTLTSCPKKLSLLSNQTNVFKDNFEKVFQVNPFTYSEPISPDFFVKKRSLKMDLARIEPKIK